MAAIGRIGRLGGGFVPPIIRGGGAPAVPNYDPIAALGSKLVAYWDATRADTLSVISASGDDNAVTAWIDLIGGYSAVPADTATRPAYQPEGMAGAPCVHFDSTQYLTCTDAGLLAALPDGAETSEIWAIVSQEALPADTTERFCVAWGGSSLVTGRALGRIVTSAANRVRSRTGIGASATNISDTVLDFTGVHVLRQIVEPTVTNLEIDGAASSPASAAAVPATTNSRLRIGSMNASAPSGNWQGGIMAIMIMNAKLTTNEANDLRAYTG